MKIKMFLILAVLFGLGSAFTTRTTTSAQYVKVTGNQFMLKEEAIEEEEGSCVSSGSFCSYIQVSPLANPSDLNDPDNYQQDPNSTDERWVNAAR